MKRGEEQRWILSAVGGRAVTGENDFYLNSARRVSSLTQPVSHSPIAKIPAESSWIKANGEPAILFLHSELEEILSHRGKIYGVGVVEGEPPFPSYKCRHPCPQSNINTLKWKTPKRRLAIPRKGPTQPSWLCTRGSCVIRQPTQQKTLGTTVCSRYGPPIMDQHALKIVITQ